MTERQMVGHTGLATAIRSLNQDASAIDAGFASVGENLSQILAIFDPTIEGLGAISARFLDEEMTSAGAALDGFVRELQALAVLLPEDVQSLRAVEELGGRATQSFGRLLNDTRMITAITRGARIEAARLSTDAWQGVGFFDQIGEQAIPAIETIKSCAADHASVNKCVAEATVSLRQFANAYAPALGSLAARLKAMVPEVETYRRDSLVTTESAARQSRKVTGALGEGIVALQGGDSTRQRIEHAVVGLRLLEDLASGAVTQPAGLSEHGILGLDAAIKGIVSAQLRATADRMTRDSQVVDRALTAVATEVEATVEMSQSLAHREAAGDGASLARFEEELRRSSELISACKVALADLDRVTTMLTGAILKFREAAADLSGTVDTIVLIGMNASLNSSRLGNQGRVLSVIAHEIKAIADSISTGTAQLLPVFNAMQQGARSINERGRGRLEQLVALDAKVDRLLKVMRASRSGMETVLQALLQDSKASARESRQALTGLSAPGHAVAAMLEAAEMLDTADLGPTTNSDDAARIEGFLRTTLWPVYTMEEERRLHREALARLAIGMPETTSASTAGPPLDAFEDFLL